MAFLSDTERANVILRNEYEQTGFVGSNINYEYKKAVSLTELLQN